jgi:hypothetical protein
MHAIPNGGTSTSRGVVHDRSAWRVVVVAETVPLASAARVQSEGVDISVTMHRSSGWGGRSLRGGEHVCAFSNGPGEQRQLLTSFVRAGLQAGDYCVVAIDDVSADGMLTDLDHDLATTPGRLHVEAQAGSHLHLSNASVAEALEAWTSILERARREGHEFIRLGGEASWWLSRGGADMAALLGYEDTLSAWTAGAADTSMLCCYDMSLFPSHVVADLVGCHREVVVDGRWLEMPEDIKR